VSIDGRCLMVGVVFVGALGGTASLILWITNSMGITDWEFAFHPLAGAFFGYTGAISGIISLMKSRPKDGAVRT